MISYRTELFAACMVHDEAFDRESPSAQRLHQNRWTNKNVKNGKIDS